MEQFKAKFIEEAHGLINQLESALLEQEEHLNNPDNVQQIFRVLHTLKGVSSMYGFNHISDLVHDLESIFDLIREEKQEFTHSIFDTTLKTVDHLRHLLDEENLDIESNQIAQKQLLNEIADVVNEVGMDQKDDPETLASHIASTPKETFYIIFYPSENHMFRAINILRMFEELAHLGEYEIVNHAFEEPAGDQSEQNAWGIYLVTDQGQDAIEDVFMFVLEDCRILKVSKYNLFNHDTFSVQLNALKDHQGMSESSLIKESLMDTIESINAEKPGKVEKTQNKENSRQELKTGTNETEPDNNKVAESNQNYNDVTSQLTSRISIDAAKLDQLMYLVSELVITKSQLNLVVENQDYTKLISIAEKIDDLSRNFRDNALNIRLVSVAEMIMPFKRMIRDLSKKLGKEVKLITQGIETELDKNVIDRLVEPVMHILRNCVDHGIETPDVRQANNKTPHGNIKFTSFYSGANVFIQIQDDGAGIDPEKIRRKAIEKGLISPDDQLKEKDIYNLIFHPGFSTAENVSDVSGRGVGMDIVRKKINEVRGEVEVNSELGLGTFITIKLHQTLSIIDTLLIEVNDAKYLVPLSDIEYCDQRNQAQLYQSHNRQVEIQDELLPFVSLRELLKLEGHQPEKQKLIIINKNDKKLAIVADQIIGEHQAVLKPLGEVFQSQQFLSGASILGDGTLALMLDTNKLVNKTVVEECLLSGQ